MTDITNNSDNASIDFLNIEEPLIVEHKLNDETNIIIKFNIKLNLLDNVIRINNLWKPIELITTIINSITFNATGSLKDDKELIKFINSSLENYNKNKLLEKISEQFKKFKNNIEFLEENYKGENTIKNDDLKKLLTAFYTENVNGQTITTFFNENYIEITGVESTKENRLPEHNQIKDWFLNGVKKDPNININDNNSKFYLKNLIEAMKFMYIKEKDKYDLYTFYIGKLGDIYEIIYNYDSEKDNMDNTIPVSNGGGKIKKRTPIKGK